MAEKPGEADSLGPDTAEPVEAPTDADGDGYTRPTDCDDEDAAIHPGAADPVDGIDEDCDGTIEGAWLVDAATLAVYADHEVDNVGASVSLGDGDGDGRADLAVSAPGTDHAGPGGECNGWGGAVYVFVGGRTGSHSVSEFDGAVFGDARQLSFGHDLAWTGDVSGDGGAELLVGAPGTFVDELARVFLYESPIAGTLAMDDARVQVVAENRDAKLGFAVDAAGDVDGDGVDDLLMGAPGASSVGHAAWVSGAARGELSLSEADGLYTSTVSVYAGFAVAGVGDLDGDGHADLVVGSPVESTLLGDATGAVYVIHGPAGGARDLADADAVIDGDAAHQELGYAVSGVGDLDGDLLPDLLLGAAEMDAGSGGSAWSVSGSIRGGGTISAVSLARTRGVADAGVGSALAAGDFDADGVPDLVLGAPTAYDPFGVLSGGAFVVRADYTGTHTVPVRGWMFWGTEQQGLAGSAVAAGGDFDGDGGQDLVVGAVGEAAYGGVAYVLAGAGVP